MASLIGYLQASALPNSHSTNNLAKAQCDFCHRKFGSLEEAEKCEREHFRELIGNVFTENVVIEFKERK